MICPEHTCFRCRCSTILSLALSALLLLFLPFSFLALFLTGDGTLTGECVYASLGFLELDKRSDYVWFWWFRTFLLFYLRRDIIQVGCMVYAGKMRGI